MSVFLFSVAHDGSNSNGYGCGTSLRTPASVSRMRALGAHQMSEILPQRLVARRLADLVHLVIRQVRRALRDEPSMPERILQRPRLLSVRLDFHRPDRFSTRRNRTREACVRVLHPQVTADAA